MRCRVLCMACEPLSANTHQNEYIRQLSSNRKVCLNTKMILQLQDKTPGANTDNSNLQFPTHNSSNHNSFWLVASWLDASSSTSIHQIHIRGMHTQKSTVEGFWTRPINMPCARSCRVLYQNHRSKGSMLRSLTFKTFLPDPRTDIIVRFINRNVFPRPRSSDNANRALWTLIFLPVAEVGIPSVLSSFRLTRNHQFSCECVSPFFRDLPPR